MIHPYKGLKFPGVLLMILIGVTYSCKPNPSFEVGKITAPQGTMYFTLYDDTPLHKASFIKLASEGYWDTLTFNRVIENFVIQGGCPDTPEGFAGSPYLIEPEFRDTIKHVYGALGAGRDDNPDKLSAGCQLYNVQNKDGLARLDGNYMIFGQMIKGFDVLDKIASMETDSLDQPLMNVPMQVEVVHLSSSEVKALRSAESK